MLNGPTVKKQQRCRPCLKKRCWKDEKWRDKFQTISQWVDTNSDELFWHFHTIFSQFLLDTSHKFNPNSSFLVRKQAGCGKEWWTMRKIPTHLKKGWDPFWRSILIFSWTYTFSRNGSPIIIALKPFLRFCHWVTKFIWNQFTGL